MSNAGDRSARQREAARLERERTRAQGDGLKPQEEFKPSETLVPGQRRVRRESSGTDREAPAGTKRVTALNRPPSRRAPGRPRKTPYASRKTPYASRRTPRAPRRPVAGSTLRSRAGRFASVLAILLTLLVIWFLVALFQPFHGRGSGRVTVTIPPRSSASQIGDLLAHDGIVSSSFFFGLRATLAGQRSSLRSGTYHLAHDMSYSDALKILTTAPPAAKVTELTVVEGRTRHQLDVLLRREGVPGSYLAATRRSPLLDPVSYGAPPSTRSLEGFLFPSTYQLRDPVRIPDLVRAQLLAFRQRFAGVQLDYAQANHITAYQILIIASIVQGEARTSRDRALIASVIYNRLKAHMPLQMDDTVRYATGNYTQPLTLSQLALASPWNTYTHAGLPITPIDSPGLASLQAAAHPASTNYLYFVVKPCGNGAHVFSASYTEFLALQSRYQAARTQRGGRSPEFCR